MKNKDIIVIFNPKGLLLDVQEISGKAYINDTLLTDFKSHPYKTLFYFGFEDRHPDMSVPLSFLHSICQRFITEIEALIKKSVEEKMENMLKNSGQKTRRVMTDANIDELFGI